jgi:hypothetical protein
MNWLVSLLVAAITGGLGLLSAGLVTAAYVEWYGVSNREGAAGFLIVGVAILGGMGGFLIGLVAAKILGDAGLGKALACSASLVLVPAALLTPAFYILADIPPRIGGAELRLEVEIKLPAGHAQPAGEGTLTLGSVIRQRQRASQAGELHLDQARLENGRWIVPADVHLFTTRGSRTITAVVGGTRIAAFLIPLPGRPGPGHQQWSDWGPQPRGDQPPWPDSQPSYRFRVQRMLPPAAQPSEADIREAEAQAQFDAIPADAPLGVWLPYTKPGLNERRAAAAIQRITDRPGLVRELTPLMLDPDPQQAALALGLVSRLPQPSADLIPGVDAAARDIIARMKEFNAAPPGDDPSYEGAADVGVRFSGWKEAVGALREKAGADFIPELQEMLELSRVRTDSRVMEQSVRRVASYYLQAWAGVAPHPDDPPPR